MQRMESYCARSFAKALEVILYALAEDVSLNLISFVTEFRNHHLQRGNHKETYYQRHGGALHVKRSLARESGLPILRLFRSYAAMGKGPGVISRGSAVIIPMVVKKILILSKEAFFFLFHKLFSNGMR